jgi:hypothetical protein
VEEEGEGAESVEDAALAATLPPRLQQLAARRRYCVQRGGGAGRGGEGDEGDKVDAADGALTEIAIINRGLAARDWTAAEDGRHAAEIRTRAVIRNAIPRELALLGGGERPTKRFLFSF